MHFLFSQTFGFFVRVFPGKRPILRFFKNRVSRINAEARLRDETIAYYESLSAGDTAEDAALSMAGAAAARRLKLDE
jgi:hypothetical protein